VNACEHSILIIYKREQCNFQWEIVKKHLRSHNGALFIIESIAYFIHLVVRLRVYKDIYKRVKEATMHVERNNKFQ
jgi:hypothetical protein